jgi:mono/diheme cytochrome c family protein
MLKIVAVLGPALFMTMMAQQPAQAPTVPAEAAAVSNPVKPTPESLAHAKTLYGIDCAICHGQNGDGKGEVVEELKLKMKDFTDPSVLKGRTDGELFYIIKNGDSTLKMPAEGPRAKDADIWALVNYLRTLQK